LAAIDTVNPLTREKKTPIGGGAAAKIDVSPYTATGYVNYSTANIMPKVFSENSDVGVDICR